MRDEKPAIDWSAPFPELLKLWMAHHGLRRRQAAETLRVPVQTLDAWLYGKSNCAFPESFALLMRYVPRRRPRPKAGR
jgi:hypothetical protein